MRSGGGSAGGRVVLQLGFWGQLICTCTFAFSTVLGDFTPDFYQVKGWQKLSLLSGHNRGPKGVYNTVKEVGYNICKQRQRSAGNEKRTLSNQQQLPLQLRSANLILDNATWNNNFIPSLGIVKIGIWVMEPFLPSTRPARCKMIKIIVRLIQKM